MRKEQFKPTSNGIREEMGRQPEPKPEKQPAKASLLKSFGMVAAAVVTIVTVNGIVSKVRRFRESWGEAEEALKNDAEAAQPHR